MEIFKFFNSAPGDARTYQAADFADYFGSVLSTGLLHTDDVPGMIVSVEDGTLNTIVSAGKAIMKGHLYENTAPLTLAHSISESTADRIDRVVLRLDLRNAERNIKLHVKEGIASAEPIAPELQRDNFIYELSLAQVRVRANTSSLETADLIDERLDENLAGLTSSLITLPTSQFQQQWDSFIASVQDTGFASAELFTQHRETNSSVSQIGHVQLSNDLDSSDETKAATSKALKDVMERAESSILESEKGSPDGVPTLNAEGHVMEVSAPRVLLPGNTPIFHDRMDYTASSSGLSGFINVLIGGRGSVNISADLRTSSTTTSQYSSIFMQVAVIRTPYISKNVRLRVVGTAFTEVVGELNGLEPGDILMFDLNSVTAAQIYARNIKISIDGPGPLIVKV